jgi:hypothetical protein
MTKLESDRFRLNRICFDDLPSGIDYQDLWKATSLGQWFGAEPSPEKKKN